jgi:hypothetical protein
MSMTKFYSGIIILFITISAHAQSIKTDYGVYPEPAPPTIPAAGGTFVDPVFGTTLLRVTDAADGSDNHQSYSYWPCFNKNSTLLYISSVGGNPTLYDFDTSAFSISNKRALFQSNPAGDGTPNAEDAIWSGTKTNHMLCHTSQKLYDYDVAGNIYSLIHDFSAAYPNIYLQQMSRSINDSVFGFTYKENVNYTNVGYIAYRASNNHIDTANMPTLDEVQVDKTGNYLVIKTGNSGPGIIEVQILNLLTHQIENLTDNAPDFSPGHSDNGSGFIIGEDNWNNAYTFRTLANPHTFYNIVDFNNDWSQGNHASMLADDESMILFSNFTADTTLTSSGIFVDEIYQVTTDGSKSVRRLCHTHSDIVHQSSNNKYWSMPKANISRDGKFAVFTSNWGSTTRRDAFVLQIPAMNTTDIPEYEKSSIVLYPNPTQGIFKIKSDQEIFSVEIRNVLGEKMYCGSGTTINLSEKPKGIYFAEIDFGKTRIIKKISVE